MSSLFDLVNEELASRGEPTLGEVEKPEVTSAPVADETADVQDETTEEVVDEAEPEEEKPAGWGLRGWLEKAGYDVEELEDLTDDELDSLAVERFQGGAKEKPPEQSTDGAAAQPARDGAKAEPPSPKPEKQDVSAGSVDDELAKLEYDHNIAQLVKQDGGRYLPVDDTPEAVEAAKVANSYSRKRQERFNKILDDPKGTLGPWMQQMVDSLIEQKVEAKLDGYRKSQEELRAKELQEQRVMQEEQRYFATLEKHKAEIYKLSDQGEPRKSLKTGKLMMTPFGREVDRVFLELAELSPNQPHSVLLDKAIGLVGKYLKPEAPIKKEAPVADKKKAFIEKARAASVDAEVGKKPATVQETVELGASTSLLEAILNDPDNQDNEEIQKLRMSRQR